MAVRALRVERWSWRGARSSSGRSRMFCCRLLRPCSLAAFLPRIFLCCAAPCPQILNLMEHVNEHLLIGWIGVGACSACWPSDVHVGTALMAVSFVGNHRHVQTCQAALGIVECDARFHLSAILVAEQRIRVSVYGLYCGHTGLTAGALI